MPITVVLLMALVFSVFLGLWGFLARSRVLKIVAATLGGIALLVLAVIFVALRSM